MHSPTQYDEFDGWHLTQIIFNFRIENHLPHNWLRFDRIIYMLIYFGTPEKENHWPDPNPLSKQRIHASWAELYSHQ